MRPPRQVLQDPVNGFFVKPPAPKPPPKAKGVIKVHMGGGANGRAAIDFSSMAAPPKKAPRLTPYVLAGGFPLSDGVMQEVMANVLNVPLTPPAAASSSGQAC